MVARLEQLPNIAGISVTFAVLNPLRSSVVSAEQLLNILLMSVTFSVLNPLRSSEVSAPHAENIPLMLVTFAVFRFVSPSMAVSFDILLNKFASFAPA